MADEKRGVRTLSIDIGGTGLKMLVLDESGEMITERTRRPTPNKATPKAVLNVLNSMTGEHGEFDRVSVGFPGVVEDGVTHTAVNLHPDWDGFDLVAAVGEMTAKPTRVTNDADMQGLGVIEGKGVELVITLGTGIGTALYVDGRTASNFEFGHHPFQKDKTYEERLGDAVLKKIGKKKWNQRLEKAVRILQRVFNFRMLYLGGGNGRKIEFELPGNVKVVPNIAGLLGGIALWREP